MSSNKLAVLTVFCLSAMMSSVSKDQKIDHLSERIRNLWYCQQQKTQDEAKRAKNATISCPTMFDGSLCWPSIPAGEELSRPCTSTQSPDKFVTRSCSKDGTWDHYENENFTTFANYSSCGSDPDETNDYEKLLKIVGMVESLPLHPMNNPTGDKALEECIENLLALPAPYHASAFCKRTFDGWGCWNDTLPGDTAVLPCPKFIPGFASTRNAHKFCNLDGTWFRHPATNKTWSNYTTCVDQDDLMFRQYINNVYIAGYSISAIALFISLFIFYYFKSLQCSRISIHKNLFISFIVNNVMWIIWYTEVVEKPSIILNNEISCQILHVIVHYFMVTNYFWMFCEGLYLHTVLVVAFITEEAILKGFYFVGWGIPLLLIIAYAVLRGSSPSHTTFCWIQDSVYQWILSGPVCVSLLLNLMFLVNIVRVLVTKLRAVNSPDASQTKKAARATIILIPLLGLHYLLTPFRPEHRSSGEAIYETISAVVTSLQGLCVAFLFCFLNGEVIAALKRKWNLTRLKWSTGKKSTCGASTSISFLGRSPSDPEGRFCTEVQGFSQL